MKKLLLLCLVLPLAEISFAQNHTARRALVEEFTSSSCYPCVFSDPVVEQFEGEAPGKFCIVKWYTPWGTTGGTNPFYNDYPLGETRSVNFYNNNDVAMIFTNGANPFNPYQLSLDALRAKISPDYSKTSPFTLDITQQVIGDSIIANVTVRQLDTAVDLTRLSLGVIVTQRYSQFTDINHYPYHTNIVRNVLPSLDPKTGDIRDALPFAYVMQGGPVQTFRFASLIGSDWDQYGLACVGVIQNNATKEVLQCNWTVPEIKFSRPTPNTFLVIGGQTPCQFTLTNTTDSDFTVYPQLTQNMPADWNMHLTGIDYPNFTLTAHSSATGTFITDANHPIRGSGDFILLFRTNPGIVVANISGSLIGNDSRDLIIKNWASNVYQSDPDITAWKNFGLDAAIINDDAIGSIFGNSLIRFRTVYVERSNYGSLADLQSITDYMNHGGRMIFNSNSALTYYNNSIIDTTSNKYAPLFKNLFRSNPIPATGTWSKGNVVVRNVFTDTLPSPFTISLRPIQALIPLDTFSKPLIREQGGLNTGMAIEQATGKIAYLTFPLSDIQNQSTATFMTGQILTWFSLPNSKVNASNATLSSSAVYPNPVTTGATIEYNFTNNGKINFALYDQLGRKVEALLKSISDQNLTIDCSSLPAGTYYYSIEAGENVARGKMVVSH